MGVYFESAFEDEIPLSAKADIPLFTGDMMRGNKPPLKREVARSAGGIILSEQGIEHRSPGIIRKRINGRTMFAPTELFHAFNRVYGKGKLVTSTRNI